MKEINYNGIIMESIKKIREYDQVINNKLLSFITNSIMFEETSNHKFEIQKNIKLNKIYLQGYVLDSPICKYLNDKYKHNYSINQLHEFINFYEKEGGNDFTSYHDALNLFEDANCIEELMDNKIKYEINVIKNFTNKILDIDTLDMSKYQVLYNEVKSIISNDYLNNGLISNECFDLIIKIINDIFNYFILGNIEIPGEYINHE